MYLTFHCHYVLSEAAFSLGSGRFVASDLLLVGVIDNVHLLLRLSSAGQLEHQLSKRL